MTLDDHAGHRSSPRRIDSEPDLGTGITARPRHIESERTHPMILTHADAHEIFVPDRFKDEETGMGYDVRHDDDEPDPRDAWMVPADATGLSSAVHIFGSDHYNQSVDRSVPAHPAIRAFMYFWGRHDGDQDAIGTALHLTRRYLRIWHPGLRTKVVAGHFDVDQSTWYDIVAASDPDTWGEPQGLIDQFLAWARGDIWGVIPDEGESLWGIYADSPENALRIFRDQVESDAAPTAVEEPVPVRTRHDWQNEFLVATAALLEGRATPDGDRIADWLADHENDHNVWCAVNRFCDELGDLSQRPNRPVIPTGFWSQITHQLAAIVYHRPATFEGVRRILLDPLYDDIAAERNRNGVRHFGPDAAFFAGSGGDETLMRALVDAGWQIGTKKASYWYTMTHPATGETLTYTEGDVELGDRITDR